jgi:2-haloacid dehalogenase
MEDKSYDGLVMDFSFVRLITFDCYGTLIDWETGILNALRMLLPNTADVSDEQLLEMYGETEARIEAGPYLSYRAVLSRCVEAMASSLGKTLSPADAQRFSESLRQWKPFPDTVESLKALAERYKLAVISNVDDDLFAFTQKLLPVSFEFVVTAQQVGSYKPSLNNFGEAVKRALQAGIKPDQILHVAQSLHHDIAPANSIGLKNVWVNRRYGKRGSGATVGSSAKPMVEVHSLAELVRLICKVEGGTAAS